MISASEVSAVLVTRGDVDMDPITESIHEAGIHDIIVWDNSQRPVDHGIYGRYAAIREARNSVVITQDDDLIVTCWPEILDAYRPGVLTVNYPEPWDIPWVARGAVFDSDLPGRSFGRYLTAHPFDRYFTHKACDGVFALLADAVNVIDHGSEDLPHGFAAGRVSTSPGWYDEWRPLIQQRCEAVKAAA